MSTTNFDTLNKAALREACKLRGISGYGKLDNDGMRAALKKHEEKNAPKQEPVQSPEAVPVQSAASAEPVVTTPPAAEAPAAPVAAAPPAENPAPVPKDARNGVTRPREGKCRAVWDACDALKAEGKDITFAALKEKLPNHADATLRTQAQRHRTFHKA